MLLNMFRVEQFPEQKSNTKQFCSTLSGLRRKRTETIQPHSIAFLYMADRISPPEATEQAAVFTPASTVDELIKAAFFVATSIDAPLVDVVSPHQLNLHYPADGSLVSVKIEGRAGAWGGIGPHGTPEDETARNEHYDAMLAAATAPPPVEPPPPPPVENPVYTVQRQ